MMNLLKNLELQGYKTFATKTFFDFPGQITAIVGPNGSGKSNIADGIRWVLGEQSYSILRGKKTVDMIFFGSDQRSRSSMASVSITFDNQNGWLPVDFSEVVITRRAYRNGENEYLLNNQRVRLKEINELLANSGLAERTYTIIGQGLIDSVLSLRPEERRQFLEEAAGIGLYRGRRDESTQKLDRTLRNMERVGDILGELKPRLELLQKSMEKAVHYNQTRADLELLLRDWYGYHWHEAKQLLKTVTEFYSSQREIMDAKSLEKEEIENQLNHIQKSLNENREKLANYHKQLAEYHLQKESITREDAVLDEREKSVLSRITELKSEISDLSKKLGIEESVLDELIQKNNKVQEEYTRSLKTLETAQTDLQNRMTQLKDLEERFAIQQKEHLSIETQILELDIQKKNLHSELEKNKNSKLIRKEYLQNSEKEIVELKKLIDKKNQELVELNSQRDGQKEIGLSYSQKAKLVKEKIEASQNQINALESEGTKLRTELEIIFEEEKFAEKGLGSTAIINAAKAKKIRGDSALIIDQIEVPAEYEIAVAAALGEALEGVLIDKQSDIREVLNYLEESKTTRTVVVPEAWIKSEEILDAKIADIKYASHLVGSNSPYAVIIKTLLNRTIIAASREQAIQLFPELKTGWKIVTTAGEVFDSNGTITAGIESRSRQIKKKRDKSILRNALGNLEKEISNLQDEMSMLNREHENLSDQIQSHTSLLEKLDSQSRDYNLNLYKLGIELEQKSQLKKQEANLLGEIQKSQENLEYQIKTISENIVLLKKEKNTKESTLLDLSQQKDTISLESLREKVLELTSKKVVAEQLANQQSIELANKREEVASLKKRIQDRNTKCLELETEKESIKNRKILLEEQNIEIKTSIESINALVIPLEEDVESIIGSQGEILEEVDKKRREFMRAERHVLQSQVKVDKAKDQLENLRKKIEEDIGLITADESSGLTSLEPLPFDELLASLPEITSLNSELDDQINQKKSMLRRIGPINPDAQKEYAEANERYQFLTDQLNDLNNAEKDLRKIINELDGLMEKEFLTTYEKVNKEFSVIFPQLFNGGTAKLILEDPENVLEAGIDIEATLPGKRKQELALLSGGERSLAAVALIFALLRISPTPFCVLDEVDAMLDESNVVKFGELLRELSNSTQFIVITHNRNTVQIADILYGVTIGKDSVSQVISLKLDELTEELVE